MGNKMSNESNEGVTLTIDIAHPLAISYANTLIIIMYGSFDW